MNNFLKNLLGLNTNDQEFGTFDEATSWEPTSPRPEDTLNIQYQGILKASGAGEIFVHYGFDSWNRAVNTQKMDRLPDGSFSTAIKVERAHEMNLCFKDSADHWDNNNGHNWNLSLQ
ncbi:MAG TPA: carbohydrate-binding protein [Firmicutes bacterium]|jgi:hypothetical protein|nr:carbohydrate-binding protein [Bacillota bacterium]